MFEHGPVRSGSLQAVLLGRWRLLDAFLASSLAISVAVLLRPVKPDILLLISLT